MTFNLDLSLFYQFWFQKEKRKAKAFPTFCPLSGDLLILPIIRSFSENLWRFVLVFLYLKNYHLSVVLSPFAFAKNLQSMVQIHQNRTNTSFGLKNKQIHISYTLLAYIILPWKLSFKGTRLFFYFIYSERLCQSFLQRKRGPKGPLRIKYRFLVACHQMAMLFSFIAGRSTK